MIANLNISEFLNKVEREFIPDILAVIGAQGVTWAVQNLENDKSERNDERTYNLENSIAWSTSVDHSMMRGETDGQPLEPAEKNTVNIGSNVIYAAMHEFGGTIHAKKTLGSVSRKQEVWAMEQLFWRKWYETNNPKWKYLALYMQKHDSLDIPAHPYLRPILTDHKQEIINIIQSAING